MRLRHSSPTEEKEERDKSLFFLSIFLLVLTAICLFRHGHMKARACVCACVAIERDLILRASCDTNHRGDKAIERGEISHGKEERENVFKRENVQRHA